MSDSNERPRATTGYNFLLWLVNIFPLILALVGMATWVGRISAQTEANSDWISDRTGIQIDAKLARIETEIENLQSQQTDMHQMLTRHLQGTGSP